MAKAKKTWYVTKKPNTETYTLHDFARSAEQAKEMLEDGKFYNAIAHKSTSEGGLYNIYRKKGVYTHKNGSKERV